MNTIKDWFHWLNKQIEWVKSFLQEPSTIPENIPTKASSKRLISISVVLAFLVSYIKVSILTQTIQDIPTMWALTIGGILGLNIMDWYVKGKSGNTISGEQK